MMKGWIALDIDGTITADLEVPKEVAEYLKSIYLKGWQFAFLTGRSYSFAVKTLGCMNFPFFLAPQNGSSLLEIPSQELILKKYLPRDALYYLEKKSKKIDCAMIVYTGYEQKDFCFGRIPSSFVADQNKFTEMQGQMKDHFKSCKELKGESFPLVKFFGRKKSLAELSSCLQEEALFQTSLIRYPGWEEFSLLLVTDRDVNKGTALSELLQKKGRKGKVIAAGNDENDLSMFAFADVKIAMADAPNNLLKEADLIAPSAIDYGIVSALKQVLDSSGF